MPELGFPGSCVARRHREPNCHNERIQTMLADFRFRSEIHLGFNLNEILQCMLGTVLDYLETP